MIDYKSHAVDQIMINCIGFLSQEQQKKLKDILDISLYKYDVYPKEENKELPATVDDFNNELLKRYIISKSLASLSPNSLKLYSLRLKNFFLDIDKKATEIVPDDIRYYLAVTKSKRNITNTTMENIRLCLCSFFGWMYNEEFIERNPMRNVPQIKADTVKETPFSQEDIELLCMACENSRDRALVEFLLSTGCRVSEASSVNRDQINFYTKQLLVIGKGNKPRTVYLSDKALVYLKIYLDERTDNEEALFITKRSPKVRMSKDSIEYVIKKLGKKAGVENAHPHRFRRTMCCTLIDRGMKVQDVKEILGHSNLDTTMIYYNSSTENIKSNFQSVNNI